MTDTDNTSVTLRQGDALLVVDVQYDFLPGGALGVPDGDQVIPLLNRYLEAFHAQALPVYATRDWHPPDHCSFVSRGGSWPPHCIAGSDGARIASELALPDDVTVISKATEADQDAYSGFQHSALHRLLQERGIRRLFVGGLATDYCVLNTVLDGRRLGYTVYLLRDAIRAVNLEPQDGHTAEQQMQASGARAITVGDIA